MSRQSERLPTDLPARFKQLFPWGLDRRSVAVREIARALSELWQDLGGVDGLPVQERMLCEVVVFIRRQMLAYETAVLDGKPTTMTAGEYANLGNTLVGHLKTLGTKRRAHTVDSLQTYLAKTARSRETPA